MTTAIGFDAIIGQEHPIRLLKTFIRNGTQPHALLFTGDVGIGKKMSAMAFAMACNCQALATSLEQGACPDSIEIDACGVCSPCRKIVANQHPDIITISPASTVIRIDQIRALLETLALKPHEARQRVVVIAEARAMNPEAANALLKVLEEPPDRTLMVLTAGQPSDLLPTVVSRCRQIRFLPLKSTQIERLLMAAGDVTPQTAATAAALCGGSFVRAQKLIDERWLRRRKWIVDALSHVTTNKAGGLRPWLALAEMLANRKDRVEESLEIVKIWLRDLLVVQYDPGRILNQDRIEGLTRTAGQFDQPQLIRQIEAVDGALTALRSNTNVRLTLDAMVVQMAGATDRRYVI